MNRQKLFQYAIIFLILTFFLGFFWPVLYSPKEEASPSASPTPASFSANATATARVAKLGSKVVLYCQQKSQESLGSLKADLEKIAGVSRVLAGGSLFDVTFTQNATAEDFAAVETSASSYCNASLAFRKALQLEFSGPVSFNYSGVEGVQSTRLPFDLCSKQNWDCLVFSSTPENSTVGVSISLSNEGGLEQGTVQEIAGLNIANAVETNSS
ncbi:MAG: hypothetical protein V1717_01905 [Candidatus Micrarchaeota archaeon]